MSSGVQKILELGSIAALGAALRKRLDASATTKLLLAGLVPSVILRSLSTLHMSLELANIIFAGLGLLVLNIAASTFTANAIITVPKEGSAADTETIKRRKGIRRTAAMQLGTMAPAVSTFGFTQEFCGAMFVGFSMLADMPTKLYTLFVVPIVARLFGDAAGKKEAEAERLAEIACKVEETPRECWTRRMGNVAALVKDPFNFSILGGLLLAATNTPTTSLGFLGKAIGQLADAQTPILFLIIGLKAQVTGAAPALCASLLLLRHGILAIATAAFLKICLPALTVGAGVTAAAVTARETARLAVVLSSQAAVSIIAYGQLSKTMDACPNLGFDLDLAFQIVSISFLASVGLSTGAALGGNAYVNGLSFVGLGMIGMSQVVYRMFKKQIDDL